MYKRQISISTFCVRGFTSGVLCCSNIPERPEKKLFDFSMSRYLCVELFAITYDLVTLGVTVALPSILRVISPELSVVVRSQTYRPSSKSVVIASVKLIVQVPSVALTFAVVKEYFVADE